MEVEAELELESEVELGGSWRGVKMGLFCLLAQ